MKLTSQEITKFQKKILEWYKKHKRDLPWRHDRDPYHILISEVMLQQTQVSRVIPKYNEWLQVFPTVQSLAKASTRDVLLHWSGLGYNRRALYLKRCAEELVKMQTDYSLQTTAKRKKAVVSSPKAESISWPQTEKKLRELPGIGEYTARAILCFACNKQVAVVDTNVRKVILTRIMNNELRIKQEKKHNSSFLLHHSYDRLPKGLTNKEIQAIATKLLPKNRAYDWNQALMDYAAGELKKHKIPIPKQSKFKNSDRYFRGQIVKLLLTKHSATLQEIVEFFNKKKNPIQKERLQKILQDLVSDNLISKSTTLNLKQLKLSAILSYSL